MPGSSPFPIVSPALALRKANPNMPALDILDAVMAEHRGTHPDFECTGEDFDHWTNPPSPFAEILREAFDPALTQTELQLMVTPDAPKSEHAKVQATEARWHRVVDLFGERYDLWT